MKFLAFILVFLSSFNKIDAQENTSYNSVDSYAVMAEAIYKEMDSIQKQFTRTNDSLFAAKEYNTVINNCKHYKSSYIKADANNYLIAAFYALGDIKASDSILKSVLGYNTTDFSAGYVSSFIGSCSSSMAMCYYFSIPANVLKAERFITELYDTKEKASNKQTGKELLLLLLKDQYIRGEHIGKQITESAFISADKENREAQYKFYKKTGHIPSEKEIGSTLHGNQFLLMAHEADSKRRIFYLKLIREAVTRKTCDPSRIPDFIIRTEMQQGGDHYPYKDLPKREEQARKKYGLPDYRFKIS